MVKKTAKTEPASPEKENGVLNLDELFGMNRPVKVRLNQGDFELLRPEAFGPREAVRINYLRRKVSRLQMEEDLNPEQEQEMVGALDEALKLLCKTLPVNEMTFSQKFQTLTFYAIQTAPKNVLKAALRSRGEPPSAG